MALLFLLALCLSGCGAFSELPSEGGPRTLSIATWNIQALFDGEDNGWEYDEYLGSAGWSPEKYRARITSLVRAAGEMTDRGPDVLALEEVENASVLEDLAREAGAGYLYTFFANNPGSSLGLGLLSRYPLTGLRAHSVASTAGITPRPVLEAGLEIQGQPLIILVCHWKSKLGDEAATELLRRSSARALVRRLREIEAEAPGTPVVILGDLNENHDEFYRGGAVLSALLPDDPGAAEMAGPDQEDFLVLSRQKPPVPRYFAEGTVALYSPWGEELQQGSYAYQSAWETIDHVLLSGGFFDKRGWEFSACEVLHREPFTRASGYPDAYNPATGGGLSDHLPLLLTINLAGE
ncbi:MAG: endonuclease/exonuclease/phosphatase family protein [Spirochaetaceae bacterium]|jgi:endonuclease/exonuclease/phosphatase family metal-dependent hydrolase|nr:endonuclease/exonuclease/phosphatase family protein [Spirochaetaceae bacterium]